MAKLDLQNAFWSIKLPPWWWKQFVVRANGGSQYRYSRLPFGWAYSLAICHTLVCAILKKEVGRGGHSMHKLTMKDHAIVCAQIYCGYAPCATGFSRPR